MDDRADRYARQMRVPLVGAAGQRRLAESCAAVAGLGALGAIGADLLARAGVGRLVLIDRDVVEWSNLQRQCLYTEDDAARGRPKAEAAAERLRAVNTQIVIEHHPADLNAASAPALLAGTQLVLDGTDNFATRWLLNDWAVQSGNAYVYAGVVANHGMIGAIVPGGPCLRCTWPEPPPAETEPTCRSAGVLGSAVAVIAGLAAGEALKILAGRPQEALAGFLHADLGALEFQRVHATRDPACPCCGARRFPWLDGQRGTRAAEAVCGGNAVLVPLDAAELDLTALQHKLRGTVEQLQAAPRYLRWRARGLEVYVFADGRALVRGTEDPARARAALGDSFGA